MKLNSLVDFLEGKDEEWTGGNHSRFLIGLSGAKGAEYSIQVRVSTRSAGSKCSPG
jgi:hypothetical protein